MSVIKLIKPSDITEPQHKHRKKEDWVKLHYYRDRRSTIIENDKIKDIVGEITSIGEYNKNTFYRLSQVSSKDPVWDTYIKLKSNLPPEIAKRNHRYRQPTKLKSDTAKKPNKFAYNDFTKRYGKFVMDFN